MLNYWYFIILFTISSIVMYVVDAIISFFIPAYRVRKTLLTENVINEISTKYGRGVFNAIKPEVKKERKRLIKDLNKAVARVENNITITQSKIEQKVHDEISTAITNDIPHIIDEHLAPFKNQIDNAIAHVDYGIKKMEGIESRMGSALGAGRNLKMNVRKAETIYKLQSYVKDNPQQKGVANIAMMLISQGAMSYKDLDRFLDGMSMVRGFSKGGVTTGTFQTMPHLQGSAPQEIGLPAMQTPEWEAGNLERLTEAEQEVYARQQLSAMGVDERVLDYTFQERKRNLNGKAKKERKEREEEPRSSSIWDSIPDSGSPLDTPGSTADSPGSTDRPGDNGNIINDDPAEDNAVGDRWDKTESASEDIRSSNGAENEES